MDCSHRLSAVIFKLYMIVLHCREYSCQHSWSCLWCLSFFVSYNFTATCYPCTDQGKCIFMRNKNYHLLHVVRNCVKKKIVKTYVVDGKEIFGLTASSGAQGRTVGSAETAPQKFSSTGRAFVTPFVPTRLSSPGTPRLVWLMTTTFQKPISFPASLDKSNSRVPGNEIFL